MLMVCIGVACVADGIAVCVAVAVDACGVVVVVMEFGVGCDDVVGVGVAVVVIVVADGVVVDADVAVFRIISSLRAVKLNTYISVYTPMIWNHIANMYQHTSRMSDVLMLPCSLSYYVDIVYAM